MKLLVLRMIACMFLVVVGTACDDASQPKTLPVLGSKKIVNGDTLQHMIPDFVFVNQDSQEVSPSDFEGKIYVSDFFFTSCPSICPPMKRQMLRIYEKYAEEDRVRLLSHSIDPRYDTPEVLKDYAAKLGIEAPRWNMVTGEFKDIQAIAQEYLSVVQEDPDAPGGYAHSGNFILIDTQKRIRGYYDGTDPQKVDELMKDIDWLLRHE